MNGTSPNKSLAISNCLPERFCRKHILAPAFYRSLKYVSSFLLVNLSCNCVVCSFSLIPSPSRRIYTVSNESMGLRINHSDLDFQLGDLNELFQVSVSSFAKWV